MEIEAKSYSKLSLQFSRHLIGLISSHFTEKIVYQVWTPSDFLIIIYFQSSLQTTNM